MQVEKRSAEPAAKEDTTADEEVILEFSNTTAGEKIKDILFI